MNKQHKYAKNLQSELFLHTSSADIKNEGWGGIILQLDTQVEDTGEEVIKTLLSCSLKFLLAWKVFGFSWDGQIFHNDFPNTLEQKKKDLSFVWLRRYVTNVLYDTRK